MWKGVLTMVFAGAVVTSAPATQPARSREVRLDLGTATPVLAIWRDSEGRPNRGAPYLRIAVWKDGRVLFAPDPRRWSPELREARIPAAKVAGLERQVRATGVFALSRTSYLVPDAAVDCILVRSGGRTQVLDWDEVESPHYGIGVSPGPESERFKRCWKQVNRLALAVRPRQSRPASRRFRQVPQSWYGRPANAPR